MRFRRHTRTGLPWKPRLPKLFAGHRRVTIVLVAFLTSLVLGYLFAALVLFPAPFIVSRQSVPRLVELEKGDAQEVLAQAGLDWREFETITHPTAARGTVVWQDPPAGMVVPEGTIVEVSISLGPQRIPVPDVVGYDAPLARLLIEAAGLSVSATETAQTSAPQGVAVNTRPPAGMALIPGAGVTLVVSVGAPTITVPDLIGLTLDEARIELEQAGLQLGTTTRRVAPGRPSGTVIDQRPGAGTLSAPGIGVNLVLAR